MDRLCAIFQGPTPKDVITWTYTKNLKGLNSVKNAFSQKTILWHRELPKSLYARFQISTFDDVTSACSPN